MTTNPDYETPHPLALVPPGVLEAAREVLRDAAANKDVDAEMADSIADAVVLNLLPCVAQWRVPIEGTCAVGRGAGVGPPCTEPICLVRILWNNEVRHFCEPHLRLIIRGDLREPA